MHFIFDTGAEHHLLFDHTYTDLFTNTYLREVKIMGADLQQEVNAWITKPMEFNIPVFGSMQLPLVVLQQELFHLNQIVGEDIHGILSASMFSHHLIQIDFKNHFITLLPIDYEPGKKFSSCDITVIKNKPYLSAYYTGINSTPTKIPTLLLDTGAGLPLLLYTGSSSDIQIPEKTISGKLGTGLGGLLNGYIGKLPEFSFCDFTFKNVISNYQELNPLLTNKEQVIKQGIIGNQILDQFTVVFDYIHQKVYFKPNKNFKQELDIDCSGLSIIAGGPDLRNYYVRFVVPGSAGELAGVMEGDQIKWINKKPTKWYNMNQIQRFLQKDEGKKLKLGLIRNGQKLNTTLILKKII
ncbi:MAG: hypothetical protein IT265_09875 [Saprospiraceae bacterium]|nr:hypothetical protein [Candidatus Defluviibacterium haderslevense]MCC7027253.1 hypothetical protein [Saprospiraceae bacterium]